jgi:PPM family protein phosphatase
MKTACRTDVGRVRAVNEDRVLVQTEWNGFTLAIVADGMGGHQAGDTASSMAIELIQSGLEHIHEGMTPEQLEHALQSAIGFANERIYEIASLQEKYHGMGTTVVVTLATREMVSIAYIGDSRAYMYHEGSLRQLTSDHSLVNELVRTGQITAEEAGSHPRRNVLTRALGTDSGAEADIIHIEWSEGDRLLMCSDGLSNLVNAGSLKNALEADQEPQQIADSLVSQALEAGGDDNITVVIVCNTPDIMEKGG